MTSNLQEKHLSEKTVEWAPLLLKLRRTNYDSANAMPSKPGLTKSYS